MKEFGTRIALQTAVFLIVLCAAASLYAQNLPMDAPAFLYVCNKGSVALEAVEAKKYNDFLNRGPGKYFWRINGVAIAPGKCKQVTYSGGGETGAYVAFGFVDAKGQWGSGKIAHVPDLGNYVQYFTEHPFLKSAAMTFCVRQDETSYGIDDDPQVDCKTFRLTNVRQDVGHGAFLPVTASLYFESKNSSCLGEYGTAGRCDYYLNVTPGESDRELHAVRGTGGGVDADPPMTDAQVFQALGNSPFVKALAKAAAENRQKQEQAAAAAEAERKRQAQANTPEGRLKHAQEQQAAREQRQKQVLAADAAGNPNVKVEAQMIRREQEDNRQRWAGGPQSPGAFDPQWMGKNIAVVGTVSRVEVDPNGSPQWLTIYFKESPDATFVVCSPYPDMFQERVGLNLSVLVGKTIEAAGQVESPYCGGKAPKGSIRVVESTQWKIH